MNWTLPGVDPPNSLETRLISSKISSRLAIEFSILRRFLAGRRVKFAQRDLTESVKESGAAIQMQALEPDTKRN